MPEENQDLPANVPIRKARKSITGKKTVHADEVGATRDEGEELDVDEVETDVEPEVENNVPKSQPIQRIIIRLSGKEYYMPTFFTKEVGSGLAIYGPTGVLVQAPVFHEDPKVNKELRSKVARTVARFNQQQRSASHPSELQPVPVPIRR